MSDERCTHKKITELPDAVEKRFFEWNRKPRGILFGCVQRSRACAGNLKELKINLPSDVQGWLHMRRARVIEEQKR